MPIILFIISCLSINAFEFSPSVMSFEKAGKEATRKYTIHNSLDKEVGVELTAHSRAINQDGSEKLTPVKDFSIYPSLFKLKPGETRIVKATYVGKSDSKNELAFRIIAEQLPVDFKNKNANAKKTNMEINFLYRYETSAYVFEGDGKPLVEVISFSKEKDKLKIILENKGNIHQVFQNWSLKVLTNKSEKNYSKKDNISPKEFNLLAGNKIELVLSSQIEEEIKKIELIENAQ